MKRPVFIFIGVVAISLAVFGCAMMRGGADDTWITLLDGEKGLENWNRVGTANWRAADGVVQADKKEGKGNTFLVSKNTYENLIVRVEFWVSDDANSGIFVRCQDPNKISDKTCYEANIYDQRPDPSYGTGAITNFAKISAMPKAGSRWNIYEITANGPRLSVVLNGVRTVEVEDTKFASGPIALQYGAGVVKFRKVQIKPL